MNIFYLDEDPAYAANYHTDKHVVKMTLETTQILNNVRSFMGLSCYYKLTHKNHPCCLWAKKTLSNFLWLCNLGQELADQYTLRYGKIHKCTRIINEYINDIPSMKFDGDDEFTEPPLCMPDIYKNENNKVFSYRLYYINEKAYMGWNKSPLGEPYWVSHALYLEPFKSIVAN